MSELLFSSGELSSALRTFAAEVKDAVENAAPTRINSGDIDQLVAEFTAHARLEALELLEDQITVSQSPTKVDVTGRFDYAWDPDDGPLYVDGTELSFHVPFRGNRLLLHLRPSHYDLSPPRGVVQADQIVVSAAGPPHDADQIRSRAQRYLDSLQGYVEWSRSEVERHNENIRVEARRMIEDRRRRLAQVPDLTGGLRFPARSASPSEVAQAARSALPSMPTVAPSAAQQKMPVAQLLHVFLCHASQDKAAVRKLYDDLDALPVDRWLDVNKLLPGQEWETEIKRALRAAHVVLVCLSAHAVNKEGFIQKEIKTALDIADEKPEGSIFIIPVRLEQCEIPDRLKRWHWVDLFEADGVERLVAALRARAGTLGIAWPQ